MAYTSTAPACIIGAVLPSTAAVAQGVRRVLRLTAGPARQKTRWLAPTMFLTLVVACGRSTVERQVVVVYTSVDQVQSEPILREFERRSGVRVLPVYDVEAVKTTGLVTRIIEESGRPTADVFWNGEFAQTLVLQDRGLLQQCPWLSRSTLPPDRIDPHGCWAAIGGRARVFLVNTNRLRPDEYPRAISDLLDPRWPADQVGMANPLFGTTATHAAALYATMGQENARGFFAKIKQRGVRILDGNSVVRDLVARGQLLFGLTDSDDAWSALRRGAPVAAVAPDGSTTGTLLIPSTVAIVAGAQHLEEARLLLEYLTSLDSERALGELGFCQIPPRQPADVAVFPAGAPRLLDVGWGEIRRQMPRAAVELRQIFVR
ncbi:MAG: ABC transporter substrate-binding protein [Acidobacteriota bacterium]